MGDKCTNLLLSLYWLYLGCILGVLTEQPQLKHVFLKTAALLINLSLFRSKQTWHMQCG